MHHSLFPIWMRYACSHKSNYWYTCKSCIPGMKHASFLVFFFFWQDGWGGTGRGLFKERIVSESHKLLLFVNALSIWLFHTSDHNITLLLLPFTIRVLRVPKGKNPKRSIFHWGFMVQFTWPLTLKLMYAFFLKGNNN